MELTKGINLANRVGSKLSIKLIKNVFDFLLDDSKYGMPKINDHYSYESQINMNDYIFK